MRTKQKDMALSITSIESLQTYLIGVLGRASHHAGRVEGVAMTLLGGVIWRSTGEISVREYNGNPANMIWFYVGQNKYVMAYNHVEETIELKSRAHTGEILASFDNDTPYQDIIDVFRKL